VTVNWQYNHYSLLYFLSAAVSAWLFLYGWKRRQTRGALAFTVFSAGTFTWAFGNGIEVISLTLAEKIFWANIEYMGVVVLPVAWVIFALQYTGRDRQINRRLVLLLSLVPLITIALVWTNTSHGLIRNQIALNMDGPFPRITKTYGLGFKLSMTYAYLLLGSGVLLIANLFIKSNKIYRRQAALLLLGAFTPWLVNALYVFQIGTVHYLDLTPPAFTVTGIAMAFGVYKFHLLDLVPVAHDTVIEYLSDGIVVLDCEGRIIDINPKAQKIIDATAGEAIGLLLATYLPFDPHSSSSNSELTIDGSYYEVTNSALVDKQGRMNGRLIVLHDITERKEIEKRFAQIEKLAAVGRTLSGTAHELNNPLSSILGYAQLLLTRGNLDANTRRKVEIINQEADRSRTIVQNLFAFVGQAKMVVSEVDVNELLTAVVEMRRDDLQAAGIDLHFERSPIPAIQGDLQQLQRAFLNVLVNAEQAVQTFVEKREIGIRTRFIESAGEPRVEVSISDNGPGVPHENLGKIFEPFFTTRPVGKGMGLGLSISYGVVSKHGGDILVESQPDSGAKFIITLPVASAAKPASDGQLASVAYLLN
jgi:signal transduction histidine kinase